MADPAYLTGILVGFASGFVSGGTIALVLKTLERPAEPDPSPPIYAYGQRVAGREYQRGAAVRALPVGFEVRETLPPHVRMTDAQKRHLCNLILNHPASSNGLPKNDLKITYALLEKHKIGRRPAERILGDILRLRLGWQDEAGSVWLGRHKAREFVERARRAGVIGAGGGR